MAAADETKMPSLGRLTFADTHEIDVFGETLARFERGEIGPDEWRAFRLVHGTYGQRQEGDLSMLRAKVPQGILDAAQLRTVADVAARYSRGFCHITTRQNVQFHFVRLHDVEPAMRQLAAAGLTTREACGNAVRNVTACPYAGVAADEPFDVTPYGEAMTRYFLRHPLSASLPRKFKIAFEGCADDHVATAINDIGFRARSASGGAPGFSVTVGGGTSTLPTAGTLLLEWVPAEDILQIAEAIVRVFHRLGDRVHRQRNRMKFLIRTLGWPRWREVLDEELAQVRAQGPIPLPFDPAHPPIEVRPRPGRHRVPLPADIASAVLSATVTGPGIVPAPRVTLRVLPDDVQRWVASNVRQQKQTGYVIVTVRVPLGDWTGAQLHALADLAESYGDGTVRTTMSQNVVLRWVPTDAVESLYARLAAAGLGIAGADTLADVTSCPGAESCRLAVTHSRALARVLTDCLGERPDLVRAVPGVDIKISGCPNGCGQHHIAGIGFQGGMRKVDGRALPQYFVLLGGGDGGARFARLAAKVPARRVPEVVRRVVALYERDRQDGESAPAFLARVDLTRVKALLSDLEEVASGSLQAEDFIDHGETAAFDPLTMAGECSA